MPAGEVIGSYHDLWQVEQSFRMSKTDLRARPLFSHTRESIEAHLTIVFTALAIARYLQKTTGSSIRHIVRTLQPLQQVTISVAGQHITAKPQIPPAAQDILNSLTH
jgi:transposase